MIKLFAKLKALFCSSPETWKKSFDNELSKINQQRTELQATLDTVSRKIEELTKQTKSIDPEIQNLRSTLERLNDDIFKPTNLLRQQMDAVVQKVAKENCVQCRFEVETKDDKTIVTRYEFIPKETPNTNNSRRDLGPIFFLILILVIGFFLVCWRTAIQEVSVSRTTNCSKVIAGGQNPSGCSNVVEQSSCTTNHVSCWPWK